MDKLQWRKVPEAGLGCIFVEGGGGEKGGKWGKWMAIDVVTVGDCANACY